MRSLHRLCEARVVAFDTSEVYNWIRAVHAPAFRSHCESVVLIVGHGPSHLPMDWLYAYEFSPRQGWDRDWLLNLVAKAIPFAAGKPVAHEVDIRQNYLWDGSDFACHQVTVKLTDTLVRRELRTTAFGKIEGLFLKLTELDDIELSAAVRPTSAVATGVALAGQHLKAGQLLTDPPADQRPPTSATITTERGAVRIVSPAFAQIPTSVSVRVEDADT